MNEAVEAPKPPEGFLAEAETQTNAKVLKMYHEAVSHQRLSREARQEIKKGERIFKKINLAKELTDLQDGGDLSPEARKYLARGGSLAKLLEEIAAHQDLKKEVGFMESSELDQELVKARRDYMKAMFKRRVPFRTDRVDVARDETRQRYMSAVLARLNKISGTPKNQALAQTGQIPQVVERLSFGPDIQHTPTEIAENHMHVLTDVLAREGLARTRIAEEFANRGLHKALKAFGKNRFARAAIAGTIFTASALGIGEGHLPPSLEPAAAVAEHGLRYLAAYLASRELLEGAYEGTTGLIEKHSIEKGLKI